jgi:hypothetical protein
MHEQRPHEQRPNERSGTCTIKQQPLSFFSELYERIQLHD